jgi:acetyl esterase/lipase
MMDLTADPVLERSVHQVVDLATTTTTAVAAAQVRIVEPTGDEPTFPVILYARNTGWSFCDAHTHDRGVRYLDLGTHTEARLADHGAAAELGSPPALVCDVP